MQALCKFWKPIGCGQGQQIFPGPLEEIRGKAGEFRTREGRCWWPWRTLHFRCPVSQRGRRLPLSARVFFVAALRNHHGTLGLLIEWAHVTYREKAVKVVEALSLGGDEASQEQGENDVEELHGGRPWYCRLWFFVVAGVFFL